MANYQSTYTGAYIDGVIGQKRSTGYFPTYSGTSAVGSDSHGIYINSSGVIEASTKSLITQNTTGSVGNAYTPIYINSNGQPVACDIYYTSTNTKPSTPYLAVIKSDGVMEVGQYLDFHNDAETASDYTYRLNNSANGVLTFSGSTISNGYLKLQNYNSLDYVQLEANSKGGNITIWGPARSSYWQIDAYENTYLRCYTMNSDGSGYKSFAITSGGELQVPNSFRLGNYNFWDSGSELRVWKTGEDTKFIYNTIWHFWNMGIAGSYTDAALQITSQGSGGPNGWGAAPRLAWHWGGVTAAQLGCAANGYLYECMGTGTTFYQVTTAAGSSKHIKREITNLDDEMGPLIDQLQPVSFIYDRDYDDLIQDEKIEEDIKRKELDSHIRYGLIYEDTVDIFPDICKTDEFQHGGKIINYTDLIPVLIQEIKSLRKRVAKLENEKMGVEI